MWPLADQSLLFELQSLIYCVLAILENGILNPPLPDPYHVRPEDFLHDTDLLHLRNNKTSTDKHHHKSANTQKYSSSKQV